jgi:tetratricopeptide (TPR) repeat protein
LPTIRRTFDAQLMLGTLLYKQGYFAAAEPVLSAVLDLDPKRRQAGAMRAVSRIKIGKLESGEQEARTLLGTQPPLNDVDLTMTLAEALYERGDLDEALTHVDEAIAFAPKHPIPPFWRARVLLSPERDSRGRGGRGTLCGAWTGSPVCP